MALGPSAIALQELITSHFHASRHFRTLASEFVVVVVFDHVKVKEAFAIASPDDICYHAKEVPEPLPDNMCRYKYGHQ
jgi:hypothetical protein